ncbi:MAG TPA: DUF502 domain-containing protein [Syntrophales bacterium]|jgi:uncharacterized membrane protein|nr:DUF502 domain-containing protein [Syntrophales bacterium]
MRKKIKPIFLTGLAVTIPIGLTIYILFFLISLMDGLLHIIPSRHHPDQVLGFHIPGLGIIFTLILIFAVGLATRSLLGRRLLLWGESLVYRVPLVRGIYQALKQIVDAMVSAKGESFKRVVLVEFPRKGLYTVAFVTGMASGEVQEKTEEKCINIFIPTTPNPTSGFYMMVPERETTRLDMTVEEAFKLIMSGGIVAPPHPRTGRAGGSSENPQAAVIPYDVHRITEKNANH